MKTLQIKVHGRVQGVGFRPFVYRLAHSLKLKGYVKNTTSEVEIVIQGDEENLNLFIEKLQKEAPPLSKIESISLNFLKTDFKFLKFTIEKSEKKEGFVFVSPDIAICKDCLRELYDPRDRRYRYPFINCTNCGPRYTIILKLPYDRVNTTMKKFKMCKQCEAEYKDPLSRRFHAQPISCYDCGPSLWIEGEEVKGEEIFKKIAEYVSSGKIIAIRGIGGFHIMADATNSETVRKLRERKHRLHKPFALMMKNIEMVKKYCYVSPKEEEILNSLQRPILLLKIKDLKDISPFIAPENNYLGVMLPYAPYHYLIFDYLDKPVIMTSANLSGSPIIKDNEEAISKLKGITDVFVLHNRDIHRRVDDSVGFVENDKFFLIRRSRGYAPDPIKLPVKVRPALALGGELKNTFTLAMDKLAIPSPYIGDLGDAETLELFENTVIEYLKLFQFEPEVLISDMHPVYQTSKIAEKLKNYVSVKQVQHHKAHIYSVLMENHYLGNVLGFAFDGTGYGEDGNVWGGEVFYGNLFDGLERIWHFEYFPLIGGDNAVMNPKRILLSYLLHSIPQEVEFFRNKFEKFEFRLLIKMFENRQFVLTSSMGRIFDIVASILDIRDSITYEGQAAIELQMIAEKSDVSECYEFELKDGIIKFQPVIEEIVKDKLRGKRLEDIARKFHNTVIEIIKEIALREREKRGINVLAFSGGVFQNRLLIRLLSRLEKEGFKLLFNQQMPINDGGISLGQLQAALLKEGE